MALEAYPCIHYATVMDRDGNTFDLRYASTGDSVVTAPDLNDDFRSRLAALTTCRIIKIGFTVEYRETDLVPVPELGEGEKKAQIQVLLAREDLPAPGQTTSSKLYIPGPVPDLFLAESGEGATIVDVTNADLISYLTLWYAGLGILPSFTLSDYQTIVDPSTDGAFRGKKVTHKSKKG